MRCEGFWRKPDDCLARLPPALNTAAAQYAREATDASGNCNGTALVAIPSAASPASFRLGHSGSEGNE